MISTNQSEEQDRYSDEEAQRRFEALVRAALNTPPLRLKNIPRKRPESKRKVGSVAKWCIR